MLNYGILNYTRTASQSPARARIARGFRSVAAALLAFAIGAAAQTGATRISVAGDVQSALLVKRIVPVYPPLARAAGVEGTVRLQVLIARDGSVQRVDTLSGHPMLNRHASDAVSQWKYKPTLSNGEPVEVSTIVEIVFKK